MGISFKQYQDAANTYDSIVADRIERRRKAYQDKWGRPVRPYRYTGLEEQWQQEAEQEAAAIIKSMRSFE